MKPSITFQDIRSNKARRVVVPSLLTMLPIALAGCSGYGSSYTAPAVPTSATTIKSLNTIAKVSTTVDAKNGDVNPYAVILVPAPTTTTTTTTTTTANFQPGDLLVSNFSNAAGTNGGGTTIEDIRPSAASPSPVTFSNSVSGPVALALNANQTAVWVANFGAATDGTMGDVQVLNAAGVTFPLGNIKNQALWGSWGQSFNGAAAGGTPSPAFFDTNVLTGGVYRLQGFASTSTGPNFAGATITQIGTLGHSGTNNNNVVGPQGMVYISSTDTLYVVDAVNNKIVSFSKVSTATAIEQPTVVFSGTPLNQPAGLALNPINGDLLVVNQGDNNLVELNLPMTSGSTYTATVVATKTLDPTPVVMGAGAALFGLTATQDASGNLVVYFTNDNNNTLQVLKK